MNEEREIGRGHGGAHMVSQHNHESRANKWEGKKTREKEDEVSRNSYLTLKLTTSATRRALHEQLLGINFFNTFSTKIMLRVSVKVCSVRYRSSIHPQQQHPIDQTFLQAKFAGCKRGAQIRFCTAKTNGVPVILSASTTRTSAARTNKSISRSTQFQ